MKENSSAGEWCCAHCGYVAPCAVIDETSEYRQFAVEHGVKNKPRAEFVGDDMIEDLSTGVAYDGSKKAKRLADLHRRCTADPVRDRLAKHVKSIRKMGSALGIDKSIADRACKIYREASEANLTAKKKGEVIDAACLYYACRMNQRSQELGQFVAISSFNLRELKSAIDALSSLESLSAAEDGREHYVRKYIPKLGLASYIEDAAVAVAKQIYDHSICQGKAPQGVSGAIIAWVLKECSDPAQKRALSDISAAVGPKESTIEARLAEIEVIRPLLASLPEVQKLKRGGA
jgi:transcription initiation factor TFIIIB Brf1 subunit/transcription initiation factor TFIIB